MNAPRHFPVKANIMPEFNSSRQNANNGTSAFLWDMAGTLIGYDGDTGRPQGIDGGDEFLPELGKDFRLFVTTGDETENARGILRGFNLAHHFEAIFGDLYTPLGKPYGEILRHVGCVPARSLAVGDRLHADIPADTPDIVLLLVNQGSGMIGAGMINFMAGLLKKNGDTFPAAFRALTEKGTPRPDDVGDLKGGHIAAAWGVKAGFEFKMFEFEHPLLDGTRFVIEI